MTPTLFMKVLRDIKAHKGQYIACVFIITLGLMLFSAMQAAVNNLTSARDDFYGQSRLADAFASVKSAPASDIAGLTDIDGVAGVQGRIVRDIRVTGFEDGRNIYLRLISGADSPGDKLNEYLLLTGSEPTGVQMLVGQGFFDAHKLAPGDELTLLINGREIKIPVSGTAMSAEYVYAISGGQSLLPDYATFDIAYMPYEAMSVLMGMSGMVNDLSFALDAGYNDVAPALNDRLSKYGLDSLYKRGDQLSVSMLDEEIKGIEMMATSVPSMFLFIAAIIVYMMVKRMVERQRAQIGTLKAFGYGARTIQAHYAAYGAVLGLAGGLAGGISGFVMTGGMNELYTQYFSLPNLQGNGSPLYILYSVLLALPFCTLASYLAARGVMKLRPVEAMTPEAPPAGRRVLAERINPLWNSFTTTGQMALRNMSRSKLRVIFTSACVMFAFAMCAMMSTWSGMIDTIMLDSLVRVQRFDIKISLQGFARSESLLNEFAGKDGVDIAETMLSMPVKLFSGNLAEDAAVMGFDAGSLLYNIETSGHQKVSLPESGAVITHTIAEKLGVGAGDTIYAYFPLTDDEETRREVIISGVIQQNLGGNVYMRRDALSRLLGQPDISNAAILKLSDIAYAEAISGEYTKYPGISGVENIDEIRKKTEEMMAPYGTVIMFMVVIGILTGFAIIYNSAIITLSERSRELASMRVLGFTVAETVEVLTIEQAVCGFVGAVLGIPMTMFMMRSMSDMYDTDMFSIPAEVPAYAFIYAVAATAAMIVLGIAAVRRKVKALDMVEALKSAE